MPEFHYAIKTATQASTRVSPAFLNYGRHLRPPKSLRRQLEDKDVQPVEILEEEVWSERIKKLDYLRDLVIRFIDSAQTRQKQNYDKGRRDIQFEVGDWVLRESHVLSNPAKNISAKLVPNFETPVRIVKKLSPVVYEVETGEGNRIPKVHITQLRPFYPRNSDPSMPISTTYTSNSRSQVTDSSEPADDNGYRSRLRPRPPRTRN